MRAPAGDTSRQEEMLNRNCRVYTTSDACKANMCVPVGDTRCQEEVLKQLPAVAQQTEYTTLKAELLPRMHSLCLKTTSASVRVNSLTCMAKLAARLDEDEAAKMLQTASKVHSLLTWWSDAAPMRILLFPNNT